MSNFFSLPLVWYAISRWLESFAYKTSLSWWIPGLAGLLADGTALITGRGQGLGAATKNPVQTLWYE